MYYNDCDLLYIICLSNEIYLILYIIHIFFCRKLYYYITPVWNAYRIINDMILYLSRVRISK